MDPLIIKILITSAVAAGVLIFIALSIFLTRKSKVPAPQQTPPERQASQPQQTTVNSTTETRYRGSVRINENNNIISASLTEVGMNELNQITDAKECLSVLWGILKTEEIRTVANLVNLCGPVTPAKDILAFKALIGGYVERARELLAQSEEQPTEPRTRYNIQKQ